MIRLRDDVKTFVTDRATASADTLDTSPASGRMYIHIRGCMWCARAGVRGTGAHQGTPERTRNPHQVQFSPTITQAPFTQHHRVLPIVAALAFTPSIHLLLF